MSLSTDSKQGNESSVVGGTVQQVPAPDFKLIYTNHIQAFFSALDMAFVFGEILGSEDGEKWQVQTKVRVTMSPAEAKILQTIVTNLVKSYEAKFGEINVPPEMRLPLL
jgi:hypothetical protein